jgi:hypothetical protein
LACALAERRRNGKKANLGFARWSSAGFKGGQGAAGAIPAAGAIGRPGKLHGAASSRREEEERGFLRKPPWILGFSLENKKRSYFGIFRVF